MSMNSAYKTYQNQSVTTASPGELTLMLYNGCLKFISMAKSAMKDGDFESKNFNLVKAQDIIRELMVTLDTSTEVSKDMMKMYDYIYNRLIQANVSNQVETLEEAEGYVVEFRDTWKEVLLINRKTRFGEGGHA